MATENKNLSNYDKSILPNIKSLRFALVVSEWNQDITEALYKGAYSTLIDCGAQEEKIDKLSVPGSFELIYGCKKMSEWYGKGSYHAIIAIGSVIKGETQHFEFVCEGVTQGIKDLNVHGETPVIFCVLTDNNKQQSLDRSGGKHGNKGVEAAIAAIKMATLKLA